MRLVCVALVAAAFAVAPEATAAPAVRATFDAGGVLGHVACTSSAEAAIHGNATETGVWRLTVVLARGATAPCGPSVTVASFTGGFHMRASSCLEPLHGAGQLCLAPAGRDVVPGPAAEGGAWRVDVCAVGECFRGDVRGVGLNVG